jgi:hypothetical protein
MRRLAVLPEAIMADERRHNTDMITLRRCGDYIETASAIADTRQTAGRDFP